MVAITFNTLAFSRKLQAAGVPREQAEAMADAHADAMKELVAAQDLATKADLLDTKHDIFKWMFTLFVAQTALIVAVLACVK